MVTQHKDAQQAADPIRRTPRPEDDNSITLIGALRAAQEREHPEGPEGSEGQMNIAVPLVAVPTQRSGSDAHQQVSPEDNNSSSDTLNVCESLIRLLEMAHAVIEEGPDDILPSSFHYYRRGGNDPDDDAPQGQ